MDSNGLLIFVIIFRLVILQADALITAHELPVKKDDRSRFACLTHKYAYVNLNTIFDKCKTQ